MANARPPQKRDFKTVVGDARALATVLAMEAESVLGRRAARVLGVVALFAAAVALLLVLLNWFISPDTGRERQGLALVLAIGLGGVAAIVGLYFTRQTLLATRELEAARAREAALRACLEQLGRLLTHDKWSTEDQPDGTDDTLRRLARAETLSVLGTLDGPRKRILVRFLYESQLLNKGSPGVDLNGASLLEADLSRLDLSNAALSGVRLRGADLSRATLAGSDLSGSDLKDLSNGDLIRTNLSRANLSGTNLRRTDLRGVDLREAKNLTQKQIAHAVGDANTRLPGHLRRPEVWRKSEEEQLGED